MDIGLTAEIECLFEGLHKRNTTVGITTVICLVDSGDNMFQTHFLRISMRCSKKYRISIRHERGGQIGTVSMTGIDILCRIDQCGVIELGKDIDLHNKVGDLQHLRNLLCLCDLDCMLLVIVESDRLDMLVTIFCPPQTRRTILSTAKNDQCTFLFQFLHQSTPINLCICMLSRSFCG
ncbi:hypothetical protein D1872_260080 [compost metagenome]